MLLSPSILFSQQNTLYASFQPVDYGYGIRVDHRMNNNQGFYGSISRGEYRFCEGYIKNHIKAAVGGIEYFREAITGFNPFATIGACYHSYGERCLTDQINCKIFDPFGFEVGVGAMFERIVVAVRIDNNVNSAIEVGIRF